MRAAEQGTAFSDVPATSTHAVGIYCIAAAGITTGKTATTFDVGGVVTRAQMATFLRRLLAATEKPVPHSTSAAYTADEDELAPEANQTRNASLREQGGPKV